MKDMTKMILGGCHCGAVRYEVYAEQMMHHALCHCSDCRRHSGAPLVGWAMFPREAFTLLNGHLKVYASSEHGRRSFCENCGTNLFYENEAFLPNIIDIQSATFDNAGDYPATSHIQVAERLPWMESIHALPTFERFPAQEQE